MDFIANVYQLMKTFLLPILLIISFVLAPLTIHAETDKILIDVSAKGPDVNPHMYGIFFEELNHSGDGGLYAELVSNRSFEDCNVPEGMTLSNGFAVAACRDKIPWPPKEPVPGWITLSSKTSAVAMQLDREKLLNRVQQTSLRLDVKRSTTNSPAGIANIGYWGMSFKGGDQYTLNLYACATPSFSGNLSAVLEDMNGTPLSAPVPISGLTKDWHKKTVVLTANETNHNARLALYVDKPGTLWLDVVSLFPVNTFNRRPNGLRTDLAQMLKDLKPGFLRFPGGCVTEGLTLEQGFAWKKTIGDIAERPGVWNAMWGYRRTDGIGMLEYLQLAEDIGAVSLYCNNMGIACTIHTPGGVPCPVDQVPHYVQNTVDAISYAIDPPSTKWGGLRSKHGHPQPFVLPYVNIGNELNSREYTDRYPAFYYAIKTNYPQITTIAYAPVGRPKAPVEIKDLHDYRDDTWFLDNMNRFDTHDRNGPKAANMELAVRNRTNHTLHNALLEAAYMLGLERNADVVRLVSYAPLFVNVNHPNPWLPDLIHFDNHRAFGTPSYYTQMLFMHHRPDVVLKTSLATDAPENVFALAGYDRTYKHIIIKIVNRDTQKRTITITLTNAGIVNPVAREWVLSADDPLAHNSFEEPKKVSPGTRTIRIPGPAFTHEVPPNSFTVLRIKTG